ncbi:MAG: tRNA threonylcarbamoyladenosine dehydratase [Bacteroidales bacterium]|nr:tRNA threonylcarbamoyladenosine dehydratase [Bacteroidales bacterium]
MQKNFGVEGEIFNRTERLVGQEAMARLRQARVLLFGVGGVGSWAAEGLVRSGVGHLMLVDADRVSVSNINRQLMATTLTVGQPKVEALRQRLLAINPQADIVARQELYCRDTAASFPLADYHYIVDAIDSLSAKMELIVNATDRSLGIDGWRPVLLSSMGAALKMDPTAIRVSEFWEVDGCPLAAALRRKMRRTKRFPGRKFRCVWSPEVRDNCGSSPSETEEASPFHRASINGSVVHITAIMGLTLAGLIVKQITDSK